MMAIKEDMDALRERKMRLEKEKSEVSSERQVDAAAKAKALSASVQEMKARLDSERQEYQRTHEKHMTEYQIVEKRHAAELDRLDDARSRAERDADTTMLASVNKHLKLDDSEAGSRHSLNVGEIDSSAAQELERRCGFGLIRHTSAYLLGTLTGTAPARRARRRRPPSSPSAPRCAARGAPRPSAGAGGGCCAPRADPASAAPAA